MEPGGFAGFVKEAAEWKTESAPGMPVRKATLRNDGKWRLTGGEINVFIGVDSYYYDYAF